MDIRDIHWGEIWHNLSHLSAPIQAHDLFIVDIRPCDNTADFVVMAERRRVQAEISKRLEVCYCSSHHSSLGHEFEIQILNFVFLLHQVDKQRLEEASLILEDLHKSTELANVN